MTHNPERRGEQKEKSIQTASKLLPSFSYESEGIGTKTCRDGWNHYYKMWVQFINPDSLHQSKNSSRYLVFCTCLISQIIIMLIYSISWSWSCSGAPSSQASHQVMLGKTTQTNFGEVPHTSTIFLLVVLEPQRGQECCFRFFPQPGVAVVIASWLAYSSMPLLVPSLTDALLDKFPTTHELL